MNAPHQPTPPHLRLRILATTDLHSNLLAYDYYADKPSDLVGLARTATLIKQARAEAENCLLFDNGDFLQGNPLADYSARARGNTGAPHPLIAAMNHLGYDGATLGNHEFNYGLDYLLHIIGQTKFPVVSANIVTRPGATPLQDKTLVAPYVLLKRKLADTDGQMHNLLVGVIGALPPQVAQWDQAHLAGRATTRDILPVLKVYVPLMRAAGADLVIALSHSGIGNDSAPPDSEHVSLQVAAIDGVDVVLCGHSHLVFPGPLHIAQTGVDAQQGTLHHKPAVMAGSNGSHLGLVDLVLQKQGKTWQVHTQTVQTRAIAQRTNSGAAHKLVEDDSEIVQLASSAHKATLRYVRQPVGTTTQPIHSYFAQVGDCTSIQIVTAAQHWHAREHLRNTAFGALPLLSVSSPFKTGGRGGPEHYTRIPAGNIAIRNIADLYSFPNQLRCIKLQGSAIRDWLEFAASAFLQITPGTSSQPLLNPEFASYNFDIFDGLTYQIDVSQPPRYSPSGTCLNPDAQRIRALAYKGEPLCDNATFIVATNSYRAAGGGGIRNRPAAEVVYASKTTLRDTIIEYVRKKSVLAPIPRPVWRFAPLPATSALFDSSPAARAFLPDPLMPVSYVGPAGGGFAHYRIRF